MRIRKMQATFGKLSGESISFHGGLNVIYAPNESGKSTWCAFIRSMLYGLESGNGLGDRVRYAPWSGAPMEGMMEVNADRCDLVLRRTTLSRSAPMGNFSAIYADTEEPVEGMTGRNCGEQLTGVTREVFKRSAFIEQGRVAVDNDAALEKRIRTIVSGGDEKSSYTDAADQLETKLHRRRGALQGLEEEIDDTEQRLREMETSVSSVQELEEKLESVKSSCDRLEEQVTEARRRQRTDALTRLRDGRQLVQERSDSHDEALAALDRARDTLRRSEFGDRTGDELEEEISADREALMNLEAPDSRQIKGLLPAVACSVLAILLAAFYGASQSIWLILGAGLFCMGAVYFFMQYSRAKQAEDERSDAREEILRKYKISVPEDLEEVLRSHMDLEEQVRHAEEDEAQSRERLENAQAQLRVLEDSAVSELDFVGGDSEASRLSRELQRRRNEAAELTAEISRLNGRLSAMGDPVVVGSLLNSMQERYNGLLDEIDAISLASELLRDADAEIRDRFSPELSRLAAEYMKEMTGGRYEEVLIAQDFEAKARSTEDAEAHEAAYLSAGTMDLLYLAVRLAVCELALPDGEPCPLIIDDALVNLDYTRYAQAMGLLKKIALKRQVILFTCRKE